MVCYTLASVDSLDRNNQRVSLGSRNASSGKQVVKHGDVDATEIAPAFTGVSV